MMFGTSGNKSGKQENLGPKHTVDLTDATFEQTANKNGVVLIDFWAPWCAPCRAFAPVFERAAAKHPGVTFAKVNTEEQAEIAGRFQITAIPTLVALRDGIPLFAQAGMLPEAALDELVTKINALDMDEVRRQVAKAEHDEHEHVH
jgi:thioredoxin 1